MKPGKIAKISILVLALLGLVWTAIVHPHRRQRQVFDEYYLILGYNNANGDYLIWQ